MEPICIGFVCVPSKNDKVGLSSFEFVNMGLILREVREFRVIK